MKSCVVTFLKDKIRYKKYKIKLKKKAREDNDHNKVENCPAILRFILDIGYRFTTAIDFPECTYYFIKLSL